ncbi:Retrovirus-related Pol polyprotein from transposon 17.6 [Anthophora plagiata]
MKLCHEFEDIFHLPDDVLTTSSATINKIPITNNTPIQVKPYRYLEIHRDEVSQQSKTSTWSSPLWVVPKKTDVSGQQNWRIVIDYRRLNEKIIGNAYSLPHIEDILDQLGHAHYFTTLNLANGFHQISVHPDDAQKTGFSTPEGHFEYTQMPFDLKNAPAVSQRMVHNVLIGLSNKQCFVYLDDVVIHGFANII